MISWPMGHMKDGGGGAKLGLRLEGGSESSSMIVLLVILPRMEHQTKHKRRRAFEGCGRWHLIPDTADNRTTPVEGIGRGRKRGGLWSVNICAQVKGRSHRPVSRFFYLFIFKPRTPGGPTSLGSVILGDCRNSFFVFVSDRSRSGLAKNSVQICFFHFVVPEIKIDFFCLFLLLSGFLCKCGRVVTITK
jgi:hypothetical protein